MSRAEPSRAPRGAAAAGSSLRAGPAAEGLARAPQPDPFPPAASPPARANVRPALIPHAALREGCRIFHRSKPPPGNKASPGETRKPTAGRKLTAFSPAVRPTLKHAPPAAPQAPPAPPPGTGGSSVTPAGLPALAAAGREARRRGAAPTTRRGRPGCPLPCRART